MLPDDMPRLDEIRRRNRALLSEIRLTRLRTKQQLLHLQGLRRDVSSAWRQTRLEVEEARSLLGLE